MTREEYSSGTVMEKIEAGIGGAFYDPSSYRPESVPRIVVALGRDNYSGRQKGFVLIQTEKGGLIGKVFGREMREVKR